MPLNVRASRGVVFGVVLSLLVVAAAPARAAEDDKSAELKARTYFVQGEFKQALEIYTRLYVETMHPTYLRNIGRCQQNLGEPDKAIASFREYLRKSKNLPADQRAEIEGYIAEMEQLKKSQAAGAPPQSAPAAPEHPPAPVPREHPVVPTAPPPSEPQAAVVGPPTVVATPRAEGGGAFYTRAWFWIGAAAVVAGATTAVFLLTADRDPTHGNLGVQDWRMR